MEAASSKRKKELEDVIIIRRPQLHIVYFLSRNGNTEQPHLITVDGHLFTNAALHLRDVKKWISDLRGREMADSFSWSYKRKYKGGYIWEDLTDDDIINPISDDHEYVIKGSLLPSPSNSTADSDFFIEENIPTKKKIEEEKQKSMASTSASKKPHETLSFEENAASSSFAERERRAAVFKLDSWRAEKRRAEEQRRMEIVPKKNEKGINGENSNEIIDNGSRRWASDVLKNLFKCKTVETKDSVTRAMSNHGGGSSGGGSESNTKSYALRKKCETSGSKGRAASSAMYKPASEPSCSQCGRPFRPEKMNVHMNSCKALKERGRR